MATKNPQRIPNNKFTKNCMLWSGFREKNTKQETKHEEEGVCCFPIVHAGLDDNTIRLF